MLLCFHTQPDVLNDKPFPVFVAFRITDLLLQKLRNIDLLLPLPFALFILLFSRHSHLDNLLDLVPYLFGPMIIISREPYHILLAPFRYSNLLAILESYSCAGSSMLAWGLASYFIIIITINRSIPAIIIQSTASALNYPLLLYPLEQSITA